MRFRRLATVAAIALSSAALMAPVVLSSTPAWANGSGNQWHYGDGFLNAWSGGPWVKVYNHSGVVNNDFTLINNAGGWELEFTGNGFSGQCIGDAYNDPNNNLTSLSPCGGAVGGGSAPWGGLFDISQPCGAGEYAFRNRHWSQLNGLNDYLGPNPNTGFVVGSPWYLANEQHAYCMVFAGPA